MSNILIVPNTLLRKKACPIKNVGKEEILLSKNMIKIMNAAPGVGLAATQLGELKRIIVINIQDPEIKKDNSYALFNPQIIWRSKNTVIMEEGCLSVPKQFAEIERPEKIKFKFLNNLNKEQEKEAAGFEARVVQHEVDHLDGKLFLDYLSNLKRNIIIKKVKKLKKMGEI